MSGSEARTAVGTAGSQEAVQGQSWDRSCHSVHELRTCNEHDRFGKAHGESQECRGSASMRSEAPN
eukprot:2220969-Amphidinium_carterae.1